MRMPLNSRAATILLTTLIVLVAVGGILLVSSQQFIGVRKIQTTNMARQQASYAAEAVAALVESKLTANAGSPSSMPGSPTFLDDDIAAHQAIDNLWYKVGFCQGAHSPNNNTAGFWIRNC